MNYMKLVTFFIIVEFWSTLEYFEVEMDGLTGKVKFDQFGLRTDFQLEIVELKKKGLEKVFISFRNIRLS